MNEEKLAVITGGLGDIGTSIVKQLSKLGTRVVALDVFDDEKAAQWLNALATEGVENISYYPLDVTDFDSCGRVVDTIVSRFGHIDHVINNAGITRDSVFTKMSKQQWDEVISVNLDGMFHVSRHVVPIMKLQQSGRIVNISSVNAQKGQFSQANYAASKAGVYGFSKSLAQELMSSNITVNSISPGYVNTKLMKGIRADILDSIIEQIPAKRLAEPHEVAWAVEFLLSDNSSYITGANLSINGGLHMY